MTDEEKKLADSWAKLGVSIHMVSEKFDFWLVPKYTEQDRLEMTPEHFFMQRLICDTFGATVDSFTRPGEKPQKKPEKVPY